MEQQKSNVLPFRRVDASGQVKLPLGWVAGQARPLDERRIAHRRRMLEFLRGQTASRSIGTVNVTGYLR